MKRYELGSLRPILVMVATAVIFVMVFLAMYKYDNKYTMKTNQPAEGVLDLSHVTPEMNLHSLVDGWEFYPGELLKPEAFKEGQPELFPRYVSLGQFTHIWENDNDHWLLGTFRLTIILPDNNMTYAIEVPEISAASRIYIQDTLVLQRGDPARERDGIGRAVIPVKGRGRIQLVIQAADLRSVHPSMFAPPIFGLSQEVMKIHSMGFLLKAVIMTIAACAAVLSLHLAIQIRWWRGGLFFFLCLSFVGFGLWTLIRTVNPLRLQPWYAVGLFSFHGMLWLTVILENDLYNIKGGRVSAVMGVFCVVFLIFGCYVQYVPVSLAAMIRYLMEWYKYAVAFYLIMVANTALVERMEYSQTLLVMAVIFAVTLFMEQVLPNYEPVIGCPFIMVGCCALMSGMLCILWNDMVDAFHSRTVFIFETSRMARQLSVQQEYYQQLSMRIQETRRLRHDMRHHLRAVLTLAGYGDIVKVRDYLNQLMPTIEQQESVTYTGNFALDAVICHYIALAGKENIDTDIQIIFPEQTSLPDDELCVLFGNLLENAVEACKRQETDKKFLYLRANQDENRMSIVLDNSYDGNIRYSGGYFSSSKREGMGIGVESVKSIIKKHGGIVDFKPEEKIFRVSVLIPNRYLQK